MVLAKARLRCFGDWEPRMLKTFQKEPGSVHLIKIFFRRQIESLNFNYNYTILTLVVFIIQSSSSMFADQVNECLNLVAFPHLFGL